MFRTYFTLVLIIIFFSLYWIGLEIPWPLDNLFLIIGIFPTIILISLLLAIKANIDKNNNKSLIRFIKAVSGFPTKSFAFRTILPLTAITVYLGVKFLFFTIYGTSRNWNAWVAFTFYLGMTLMILYYYSSSIKDFSLDSDNKKLKRTTSLILTISKVIIYTSSAPTLLAVGLTTFALLGGGATLSPKLPSFMSGRALVPFDFLLLTIIIIQRKPKKE